jgi:hypothetical protein
MSTYATRDVLRLCKLSTHQVRQLVRQGWVTPDRDSRGRLQFDLAMIGRLKRAHQLIQQVAPRRLGAALRRMQGMPNLDSVLVVGGELVITDGTGMWEARTGQVPMDFEPPSILATQSAGKSYQNKSKQGGWEGSTLPRIKSLPSN